MDTIYVECSKHVDEDSYFNINDATYEILDGGVLVVRGADEEGARMEYAIPPGHWFCLRKW